MYIYTYMVEFQEALIPKFVWDFVKTVQKNKIKAGILALLIYNFMHKNENYAGRLSSMVEAISDWKDIGSDHKKGKVKRWKNGSKMLWISRSKPGKYSVFLNDTQLQKQWQDELSDAISYANRYMKVN